MTRLPAWYCAPSKRSHLGIEQIEQREPTKQDETSITNEPLQPPSNALLKSVWRCLSPDCVGIIISIVWLLLIFLFDLVCMCSAFSRVKVAEKLTQQMSQNVGELSGSRCAQGCSAYWLPDLTGSCTISLSDFLSFYLMLLRCMKTRLSWFCFNWSFERPWALSSYHYELGGLA